MCTLTFYGQNFEVFVINDNFPIHTSGLLGLNWEIAFKAEIRRANNEYTIFANNEKYILLLGLHPIAKIPPRQIGYKAVFKSNHADGIYFVDGGNIIPGLYESHNNKWNIFTFNDSDSYVFLHREMLIVKPHVEITRQIKYFEENMNSCSNHNYLSRKAETNEYRDKLRKTILNNKLSSAERQPALSQFYATLKGYNEANIYHTQIHNSQTVRAKLIFEKFKNQIENIQKELNEKTATDIRNLLCEYNDIFVLPGDPLPAVGDVEHKIKLNTDKIIRTPVYKHPLFMQQEIEDQIENFKRQGLIRDSSSPYQSNVWLVPRKLDASGKKKWRLVMDFRKINAHTTQDNYPLPSIEEILCLLGNAKYISAFDMSNGFHAVKVASEDIEKTAFSTHKGHWEWVRMPMGLINSPATYQRMINFKLRGLIGKVCFIYVDDLIVFGSSPEEHIRNLYTVFDRLRETRLMLNPDKCTFLQRELEYLGHRITPEGIKPLERNAEKILNFPQPKNRKELERFIGMASYYRKFIQNFAKKTHNMNRLKSKNIDFNFDEKCIGEFENIRKIIGSYPILAHPDNSRPFILHTDASNEGLGATLSQIGKDDLEHPVSFISRSLNPCEKNYSVTEKELLAATWAMKKYKYLLFGQRFDLYTDHQPLRGIFNNKSDDVSSRMVRLISKTTDYHPNIIYKKGKDNVVADALSRAHVTTGVSEIDAPPMDDPFAHIDEDLFNHLNNNETRIFDEFPREINNLESVPKIADKKNSPDQMNESEFEIENDCPIVDNSQINDITRNTYIWINESKSFSLLNDFKNNRNKSKCFLVSSYINDTDLNKIKNTTNRIFTVEKFKLNQPLPPTPEHTLRKGDYIVDSIKLQNHLDIEYLIDLGEQWELDKLIEISATNIDDYNRAHNILNTFIYCSRLNLTIRQFLPKYVHDDQTKMTLIARIHERAHWGTEKTYNELKENYTWVGMKNHILDYVKQCSVCSPLRKHFSNNTSGTVMESPKAPFEILNADIFYNNSKPNLIIIDELSRYIWITSNVNLKQVHRHLKRFFLTNGIPKKLIVDNGPEFRNKNIIELCNNFGIHKINIAAYHPQSNGVCERVIGTVKSQLEKTFDFDYAAYNYNHSIHSTTKRMPITVLYGIKPQTLNEAIDREQELNQLREDAIENINKAKQINKNLIDKKQTCNKDFNVGDIVRIKITRGNKICWSDPVPIKTCNKTTKTITAQCRNTTYVRHFNEIEPYTQNREILTDC